MGIPIRHFLAIHASMASLALCGVASGQASSSEQPSESHWLSDALLTNSRVALDLSERVHYSDRTDQWESIANVGLDYHKVVTGDDGDIATIVLQAYLTRFDGVTGGRPPPTPERHEWDFNWRILEADIKLVSNDSLRFKVGHLELPFGLEDTIDTNGTVRSFDLRRQLGMKADWGVGIAGTLPELDYELVLTRGTGSNWHSRGDPFAMTGRVGTPSEEFNSFGLSGFHGEVRGNNGRITRRTLAGLDGTFEFERFTLLAEVSAGTSASRETMNGLLEVDFSSDDAAWLTYSRINANRRRTTQSWNSMVRGSIGFRWQPDNHWDASGELRQDLYASTGSESTLLTLQIRYRF